MKKIIFVCAMMFSFLGLAQEANNYKYIILPEKFGFQKEPNQYNISNLTQMLFEKYGFVVYFPNQQYPPDLAMDRCKALYGDVVKDSGMLNTKLYIELKDCQGNVVFRSQDGRSKEKEWKKAYYEALRAAGQSLDGLNYTYTGDAVTVTKPVTKTEAVEVYVPSVSAQPATGSTINLLSAQKTDNGYELLDKSKKIVLKMFRTSQPDHFIAQMEDIHGMAFKKEDGQFYFEFYLHGQLISQKLNIQF